MLIDSENDFMEFDGDMDDADEDDELEAGMKAN